MKKSDVMWVLAILCGIFSMAFPPAFPPLILGVVLFTFSGIAAKFTGN